MANHYKIKTEEKLTIKKVDKYVNEFIKKWSFDLYECSHFDDNGKDVWLFKSKIEDIGINFWINENNDLEFRHGHVTKLSEWLNHVIIEFLSNIFNNSKLYDDGVGDFERDDIVNRYNGFKELFKKSNMRFMPKLFSAFYFLRIKKQTPKNYRVFFESYKESIK